MIASVSNSAVTPSGPPIVAPAPPRRGGQRLSSRLAFTLIEIMVVVAIIGIVMTMSVPIVYKISHKEALRQAVSDVVEVCSHARAQAIMQGSMTEVVFHPKERHLEVGAGSGPRPTPDQPAPVAVANSGPAPSGMSAQIADRIVIEMLDVNLSEYKDAELARIRFYPNGTCDEMTLILHSLQPDQKYDDAWRKISLEVTTGLASVESDPRRFR
jgi:prepilin-type N-terminal cleavage/methylation domain-containing protein